MSIQIYLIFESRNKSGKPKLIEAQGWASRDENNEQKICWSLKIKKNIVIISNMLFHSSLNLFFILFACIFFLLLFVPYRPNRVLYG